MAIGLLSAYLFTTTELGQLFKIPFLIGHYLEHKASSNLSLAQFLSMHYAHGDVRDADNAKDMKLPFKTHENCTNFINTLVSQPFLLVVLPPCSPIKKNKHLFIDNMLTFSYHSSIWQPPKFC